MQKLKRGSLILGFLILLGLLLPGPLLQASFHETSFVYLTIKSETREIMSDYFFEIMVLDEYILLPLGSLATHLELNLEYNREKNVLYLEHKPSGKSVNIDFEKEKYTGFPEWSDQPPIRYEGDFYVSSLLLEEIAGVNVLWQPRRQELTITGEWPEEEEILEEQEIKREPWEILKLVPDTFGPDYSLGSLHYQLSGGVRKEGSGDWIYSSGQKFQGHGRAGGWALSLGLESSYDFTREQGSAGVSLIRGTYRDEDLLMILGDTRVELPQTIKRQTIRGFYYQSPPLFMGNGLSLFTVSGKAEAGAKVSLFINGNFFEEQTIKESEKYLFRNIPLIEMRTNTLRLVIENPDGTRIEETKRIAGFKRILPENTGQEIILAGLYGKPGQWEGNVAGFSYREAIYPNLTLKIEGIRKQFLTPVGLAHPEFGLIVGMSGRIFGGTVLSFDFLGGGTWEELRAGFRTSVLQTRTRGHLDVGYSYAPPAAVRVVDEIEGHRLTLEGGYDISSAWSFQLRGDLRRSLPEMVYSTRNRGIFTLTYRDEWRHVTSLSLIGGIRAFDIETGSEERIRVDVIDGGVGIDHNRRGSYFDGKFSLGYLASRLYLPEEEYREEKIEFSGRLSRSFSQVFRWYGNWESELLLSEGKPEEGKLDLESNFRFNLGDNTFLSGKVSSGISVLGGEFQNLEQGQTRAELSLLHFLGYSTSLRLSGGYNLLPHLNQSFYSSGLSFVHHWADRRGTISLNLEYKSPVEPRENYQLLAGMKLGWSLPAGLNMELEANRSYQTIYEENPDYGITVSISQALGFARDKIIGQSFERVRGHNAFIGGTVYLDLNGNGKYDEGEPLLEGIPVTVGGLRGVTNDRGQFVFENIHPGVYSVNFDQLSLPADYSIVTGEKTVEIRENENVFLEMGLTVNGVIAGRVFLDASATGTFDLGDEPLAFIEIYSPNLDRRVYTRRDGSFYMENVPLGEHIFRVSEGSLPSFTTVGEMKEFSVTLTQESIAVENILIPVTYVF